MRSASAVSACACAIGFTIVSLLIASLRVGRLRARGAARERAGPAPRSSAGAAPRRAARTRPSRSPRVVLPGGSARAPRPRRPRSARDCRRPGAPCDRTAGPGSGRRSYRSFARREFAMTRPAAHPGPVGFVYDPARPDFQANAAAIYRELRDRHPVYHNAQAGFWALSRFDDVFWAAGEHAALSSENTDISQEGLPQIQQLDPPRHDALRRLAQVAFTPRRVRELEPRIRAIARELIDGFAHKGEA